MENVVMNKVTKTFNVFVNNGFKFEFKEQRQGSSTKQVRKIILNEWGSYLNPFDLKVQEHRCPSSTK